MRYQLFLWNVCYRIDVDVYVLSLRSVIMVISGGTPMRMAIPINPKP